MALTRVGSLLVLVAGAAAKLNECASMPGVFTGVDPADFSGTVLNTQFPVSLKFECDAQHSASSYSASGVPCGIVASPSCMPGSDVAFLNEKYPLPALDALAAEVQDRLERGADNTNAASLLATAELELTISEPTQLNITFLSEGACDRNSVGMARFPWSEVTNGNPRDLLFTERKALIADVLDFTVIFPNVDLVFCQCDAPGTPSGYDDFCTRSDPQLPRGTTLRLLEDFRASDSDFTFDPGYFVTFFVIPDGFDAGFQPGGSYDNIVENFLFSTPELNDPDLVRKTPGTVDLRQHAFVFKGFPDVREPLSSATHDFSDEVFFCFEDRRRFNGELRTDVDFEDVCFFISSDPPIAGFEPSAAPTARDTAAPSEGLCSEGLLSDCGNVCCHFDCGTCGGCDCAKRETGAEFCCVGSILFNNIPCVMSGDVGCVIDSSAMCPEPGDRCRD